VKQDETLLTTSGIDVRVLKIAAFAPMPSASEMTATAVTNGVLNRVRNASFTFLTESSRAAVATSTNLAAWDTRS
jgi:hypothetical protein